MSTRNTFNKKFTRHLKEIIDSNIQNKRFGVSELAYELNMSRSNLHRKIKSVIGESVSQYLRKVRLNKAMELLKKQDYTVSEVAFAVGFGSVNYFSKCFKDHFGFRVRLKIWRKLWKKLRFFRINIIVINILGELPWQ